ncbi:MAG: hypothetical protein AAGA80_06815 [Cyanobacteria bacterium P01_F01_bin.143]
MVFFTLFLTNPGIAIAKPTKSVVNNHCDSFTDLKLAAKNANQSNQEKIITEQNVALSGVVSPSLWWAREQFDPFGGRLIDDWLEDSQLKQIDLVVNWQLWTLLDYLDRYRLINQLGTVAREYDYNLRIINQQKQCLATYQYQSDNNPPKWEINLDGLGQDSFQVEPNN